MKWEIYKAIRHLQDMADSAKDGSEIVIPVRPAALRLLLTEYEVTRAALAIAKERIRELETQEQNNDRSGGEGGATG